MSIGGWLCICGIAAIVLALIICGCCRKRCDK